VSHGPQEQKPNSCSHFGALCYDTCIINTDMSPQASKGPVRRSIHVNPDLAGFAVGVALATIVMALGFLRGVDGFEIAFRVIATFALTWAAVFLFLLVFERIAFSEMAAARRARRAAELAARAREEAEQATATESTEERESQ